MNLMKWGSTEGGVGPPSAATLQLMPARPRPGTVQTVGQRGESAQERTPHTRCAFLFAFFFGQEKAQPVPGSDGFFLSPLPTVAQEHLKERGLFSLPAPGTTPSDYYHQMTLVAGHPAPYGDLLMQSGGAASAPHLHDYLNPVDGE